MWTRASPRPTGLLPLAVARASLDDGVYRKVSGAYLDDIAILKVDQETGRVST